MVIAAGIWITGTSQQCAMCHAHDERYPQNTLNIRTNHTFAPDRYASCIWHACEQ